MFSNTIFARTSFLNMGKKFTIVVVTKLVEPGTCSLECPRFTCISYQSRATRGRVAPKKHTASACLTTSFGNGLLVHCS